MSRINRRKHVMKETLWDDNELPKEDQYIVKVLCPMGRNLHEVITPSGEIHLVSMPIKFRKNIWIKHGDYLLVEPIIEGDKVKAEIVKIMNKHSIKYFKENKVWPEEFDEEEFDKKEVNSGDDLFVNTNHVRMDKSSSDSEIDNSSDDSKCE